MNEIKSSIPSLLEIGEKLSSENTIQIKVKGENESRLITYFDRYEPDGIFYKLSDPINDEEKYIRFFSWGGGNTKIGKDDLAIRILKASNDKFYWVLEDALRSRLKTVEGVPNDEVWNKLTSGRVWEIRFKHGSQPIIVAGIHGSNLPRAEDTQEQERYNQEEAFIVSVITDIEEYRKGKEESKTYDFTKKHIRLKTIESIVPFDI